MFQWIYLDATGQELGHSQQFPDADSAEEWLSTAWRDLLENGVEEVVLQDHVRGDRVYRMGLGQE
ncbi:MAG: hypothetical protein E6G55_07555 [Actinobacteria bacterium]|nr:MAG: hypothetical protein E6G55_07555 [Actinomycetota bacterium]